MKYFMDFEFLEGDVPVKLLGYNIPKWLIKPNNTIQPISIGLVCSDGREYYAISKDFNLKEAWNRWQQRTGEGDRNNIEPKYYWLRENVLKPIFIELRAKEYAYANQALYRANVYISTEDLKFNYRTIKRLIKKYGKTNKQIAKEIKHFVADRPIEANKEQWILDYDTKDVHFYGYYSDYDWVVFCWLFGKMIDLPKGFPMYCIDLQQESDRIYNLKKEEYIEKGGKNFINKISNHLDYPKQINEHNALSDAKWNFELYKFLKTL